MSARGIIQNGKIILENDDIRNHDGENVMLLIIEDDDILMKIDEEKIQNIVRDKYDEIQDSLYNICSLIDGCLTSKYGEIDGSGEFDHLKIKRGE